MSLLSAGDTLGDHPGQNQGPDVYSFTSTSSISFTLMVSVDLIYNTYYQFEDPNGIVLAGIFISNNMDNGTNTTQMTVGLNGGVGIITGPETTITGILSIDADSNLNVFMECNGEIYSGFGGTPQSTNPIFNQFAASAIYYPGSYEQFTYNIEIDVANPLYVVAITETGAGDDTSDSAIINTYSPLGSVMIL